MGSDESRSDVSLIANGKKSQCFPQTTTVAQSLACNGHPSVLVTTLHRAQLWLPTASALALRHRLRLPEHNTQ